MKFIDLYAGIGGFRYALESLGHECVFSSEKDKYAIETYYKNFPSHNPSFDMDWLQNMNKKEINQTIPNHDILCAGFPCQPFSMGGIKKGFLDNRGSQFFNILKILDVKKPKYIFLENVSNIINHNNGKTFSTIKKELKKRNYHIQEEPIIFSPHQIGIPQRRYRAFFYAEKGRKIQKELKFKKVEKQKIIKHSIKNIPLENYFQNVINAWEEFAKNVSSPKGNKIPDIWVKEMITQKKANKNDPKWKIKYLEDMNEFYLFNKSFIDSWYKKWKVNNFRRRESKFEWRAGKIKPDFKNMILMFRTSGLRVMPPKIFPTLVAMAQIPVIFDKKINSFRKLTVDEVARLQSFPDNFLPNKNVSKMMKQFGNSVNVEVIRQVAKSFIQ